MSLRFLLDEHLRGPLWLAIQRHNVQGGLIVDAVRVGDPADLRLGSADLDLLCWAEREDRILLIEDRHTMAIHLTQHLRDGRRSPGVFVIRLGFTLSELVNHLELVAHAGEPADYENRLTFIP